MSSYSPVVSRIQETFLACSEALELDDFKRSDDAIADLTSLLNSLAVDASDDGEVAGAALMEIRQFLSSPDSNQLTVDAVALSVLSAVARLAGTFERCRHAAENVMECIVSVCSPRDLLPILCEGLDSICKGTEVAFHAAFLLGGLKKVLPCIKRQSVQQLQNALPIVIKALHAVVLDTDEEQQDSIIKLFDEAYEIALSIQQICENSHVRGNESKLRAMLGLYILQVMALLMKSNLANEKSDCIPLLGKLATFFPACQLSYVGLITGSDVTAMIDTASEDNSNDFIECFTSVNDGASLAVVWSSISSENFAGSEELTNVMHELRSIPSKRWQAISMLRHILSLPEYPWWIKSHTVDLLLSITNRQNSGNYSNDCLECSSNTISLFGCLQAIEKTIIYAPDPNLRKKSFSALKEVLDDLPFSQQFDMLLALITNSSSPSMVAILLDVIKEKFFSEYRRTASQGNADTSSSKTNGATLFWGSPAIQLIEIILKPPKGGPPSLPEQTEPVLSALNLYRFILLTESAGKTNFSGALSEKSLRKAYTEWLLPLKTLLGGMEAEGKDDNNNISETILCSINPVQLVLHRCIELVEEFLQRLK